jgi:hypothetical protein
MLEELKFPDINHLIPIEKKYDAVVSKNLDFLIQIATRVDEILIKGTIDAFLKIDSEKRINLDVTKYRSDVKDFVMITLGVSFAIGREYAETNPDNARSCVVMRNLSSVLLLDSTKKELLDLSQHAATPLTRLSWLLNHYHLVSENSSLEMIDSNLSMCQDAILQAFQGGIISFFVLQKTGNPDIPISQFITNISNSKNTPGKEQKESMQKNYRLRLNPKSIDEMNNLEKWEFVSQKLLPAMEKEALKIHAKREMVIKETMTYVDKAIKERNRSKTIRNAFFVLIALIIIALICYFFR